MIRIVSSKTNLDEDWSRWTKFKAGCSSGTLIAQPYYQQANASPPPGSTCIFATKPHCILAELKLESREHTYTFQARLPPVLPPSFKGVSTKYSYFVTVCVKLRSEESARMAHIPFYVAGTPGSLGDAARRGAPLPSFTGAEIASSNTSLETPGRKRLEKIPSIPSSAPVQLGRKLQHAPQASASSSRRESIGDEEEELVMLNARESIDEDAVSSIIPSSLYDDEGDMLFQVNRFPQRYGDGWNAEERSVAKLSDDRVLFSVEDDDDENVDADEYHTTSRIAPSPLFLPPSFSPRSSNMAPFDNHMVRAFNALTAKARVAKCFVSPYIVHPGDAINIRFEFVIGGGEKCTQVTAYIQLEERAIGPPPPSAAFEPILRKRQGAGPWTRTLSKKSLNVSICNSCAFSLSSYGVPSDFSTDLIVARSFLKLEFTTETMTSSLRVPLNVRPAPRSTRIVNIVPGFVSVPSPNSFVDRHASPLPTPTKKLLF